MTPPTLQNVELAVSVLTPAAMDWIDAGEEERAKHWKPLVHDHTLASWLGKYRPTHLYIGSEFCEHLLPSTNTLQRALQRAKVYDLQPVLLTPIASPQVMEALPFLLRLLPEDSEVVVNDWGTGRMIARQFPTLRRAAGRILCRMIKDPRLPGPEWAPQCGYGFHSQHMQAVFQRLDLQRLEMDVPLFPDSEAFAALPLPKGVHLPYAYVAKGRMCRIGSMSIPDTQRFAVGRQCRKECMTYTTEVKRPEAEDRQQTRLVGNTVFSFHTAEMLQVVMAATNSGGIERIIVPGSQL